MSEERKKVLEMLATGKITTEDAERLLDKLAGAASSATGSGHSASSPATGSAKPKFLRIVVEQPGREQVNMRVPLSFVGSGARLLAVMPQRVTDRLAEYGIDARVLSAAGSEGLGAMREIDIDVEKGNGKKVRIFCE